MGKVTGISNWEDSHFVSHDATCVYIVHLHVLVLFVSLLYTTCTYDIIREHQWKWSGLKKGEKEITELDVREWLV